MRPGTRGLLAVLLVVCSSCAREEPAPQGTIDRETFIATTVDLRRAALGTVQLTLSDADRERVLRANGVSEGELIAFADAWGADTRYMTEVWEEVKKRLAPPVATPDSTG